MSEQKPPHDNDADDRTTGDGPQDPDTASVFFMPPSPDSAPASGRPAPGTIGQYHLKRELARGGMGTVYEAVQHRPHRIVALKILRRGVASPSALRRFEFESQLLGRLRHPAIAQVYEAGTHEDISGPLPFFAMEYIPNAKPITQYAHEKKLTLPEKLELFIHVCEAVQHGHSKGIIHRDLKPGNILIDANGQVKIIDFGVARSTDSDMSATSMQTQAGELIGTLRYMSPEQCAGDPHDIDVRSDVYALGVVLYELLGGRLPYDFENAPALDTPRVIREATPVRLSRLDRTLRGDLETIVDKALQKDRERRYQTAASLGEDLRRYLRCEPIVARPPSMTYVLRRFVKRRRLPIGIAAVLIAAATVSGSVAVRSVTATREAERVRREAQRAVQRGHALQAAMDAASKTEALLDVDSIPNVIAACDRAINLAPEVAWPYAIRGRLRREQGKLAAAWNDSNRAIKLDPTNSLAQLTLGWLRLDRGDDAGCIEAFDKGIGPLTFSVLPRDLHNRALAHRHLGDYEAALADHDRAVALLSKHVRPYDQALVYASRGITYRFMERPKEAITDLSRAAQLDEKWLTEGNLLIWEIASLRNAPDDQETAARALRVAESAPNEKLDELCAGICAGKLSVENALDQVRSKRERCFVYYYGGVTALIDGRTSEAKVLFDQCCATGMHGIAEHGLAAWHLARIATE